MKNEDLRGLRRLYLGRKLVPNVQDNLTIKKTPQQTKITGKQESNALKRLAHEKQKTNAQGAWSGAPGV
jgi:hypothetical protein